MLWKLCKKGRHEFAYSASQAIDVRCLVAYVVAMSPENGKELARVDTAELTPEQERAAAKFFARPTSLPAFEAHIFRFSHRGRCLRVWEWVRSYLDVFGRQLNLEKLHELTIAGDYMGALANIERGVDGPSLRATQDEFATGVPMAPTVVIDGAPKTHLVLFSGTVAPIAEPEHEAHELARYILAHECAHIHDLAEQDKAFREMLLKPEPIQRELILQSTASACWFEYVACRLSARWAHDEETALLEDTFAPTWKVSAGGIKRRFWSINGTDT